MTRKKRWLLAVGVVAAVGCGFTMRTAANGTSDLTLSGVIESREIQIGSKIAGRVTDVLVEEGQLVQRGQVMVRFDAAELVAQRDQLVARIAQSEAEVAKLRSGNRPEEIQQLEAAARAQQAVLDEARKGPRPEEIQQAQAEHAAAKAEASNAATDYGRMLALFKSGDISAQRHDEARARRDATAERAEAARQRVALLEAGTRPEQLRAAESRAQQARANAELARKGFRAEDIAVAAGRLAEAKARLDELQSRLAEAELAAPATARIETVGVRPGDLVQPGRVVVTMLEPAQLWVRIYVPEPELGRVKVGQKASVSVDTFKGRTFEGSVQSISSQAEFLPRNVQTRSDREHQVFGVKVRVDNRGGELKSGMAATVRIEAS